MDLRHRFHSDGIQYTSGDQWSHGASQFSETAKPSVEHRTPIPPSHQPLISTDVLDIPNQRALMFAIFVIIQAYKLYDLILLKSGLPVSGILLTNSRFNFISKYLIIDSLFLYFLPNFKIPKLSFKPVAVFFQIMLLTSVTVFLSSEHSFPLVTLLLSAWSKFNTKELSLTGNSVNHRKVMDPSVHFRGAHTIKILPENTAILNPFHDSYCLPMDDSSNLGSLLQIPIRVNSTSEIDFVQLEYRDLLTNDVELWNFTKKDLTKIKDLRSLLKRDRLDESSGMNLRYYSLPLEKTGFYQIKKIVDSKNLSLRVYKSQLVIPHCPVATITGIGAKDRCIGDSDSVSIEVNGVPPLKLKYTKSINDESYSFVDSSLQPEYFESPLLTNSKFFSSQDVSNLKWARSYPVSINLESLVKEDGKYTYAIDQVIDGFGNVMDFSTVPRDLLKNYDLLYAFKVHDLPKATLDEKFNPQTPTKRSLVLKLDSRSPDSSAAYLANFTFIGEDKQVATFQHRFNHHSAEIPVDMPGTYTLDSVQSEFCPGVVIGKSSALITKPVPPQLTVKSTPILDQCVGQVGLNFDLTFTGVPPFYYRAKIYKVNTSSGERKLYDTKKFTSQGTRNQFSYNPATEGNYEITFDELSNTLFTNPITLTPASEYTFKTSMRVKPSASIVSKHDTNLCLGGQNKIPVQFNGEPPFTLNYDIVETSSNKRTSYHLGDISTYRYDLSTPNFDMGGDYILSLVSVKDSSGCLVGLSGADARIRVRRDVPNVSFNLLENADELLIKEGSVAELPVRLSGEAPFTVTYQHLDINSNVLGTYDTKFHSNYKAVLKVGKQGIYKLTSVKDQSCQGKVTENEKFKIAFLDKPSFTVLEHSRITKVNNLNFAKNEVCQGFEETVDLALVGSAPFVVAYELTSPTGQILTKSIQVATKYAALKLPNDKPGDYVIKIKGVYDSYYGEQDLSKIGYVIPDVTIKQRVNPLPKVLFEEKGKTYRTCSANIDQNSLLDPIKLHFTSGQPPYSVSFTVYHESTSKTDYFTLDEVTREKFDYRKLYEGLKLGNHIVTIERVVDSNGCAYDVIAENNHILISVTDVPKISLVEPSMEYCVGDYVAYQLNGIAPFTIKYDFNGIPLKSKEHTSQFVRFASEPGTIAISSIQDSSSQCVVNFTKPGSEKEYEKLSLVIHPIPSVTVSQGDYVVEDIHEGDQAEVIFSFEGTPPFSLTYVRTEEVEGKKGKKRPQIVETHKVSDIYAYEYRVVTSLQGTYEATEVSDAFCFAKNDAYFNN